MIQLKAIGTVHNGIGQGHRDTPWEEIESTITVDEEWRDALDGLEGFTHIWVLFFFDRMPAIDSQRGHPMARDDMPIVGRFATRSPMRPNPIGMTAVRLLERRGTTLRVRGLDAIEGTPVLDIKPYLPRRDAIVSSDVPEWARKYWGPSDEGSA